MPAHAEPREIRAGAGIRRLVALGDPHGAADRVRAVLDRERDGATLVVSVGDVIGYANGDRSSALVGLLADEKVPSVRGNHEDWMRPDGTMFLVSEPGPRRLAPEALATVRGWPLDLRILLEGTPPAAIRVTHSLHDPDWAWVVPENAGQLLEAVAPETVTVIGHSHRPAIFRARGRGPVERIPFIFPEAEELTVPIEPGARYILDCGSLARAELDGARRDFSWGTYGVVDLGAGAARLRRIQA
ncbi:MAG: metallophosphatase family protein [Planctomycetales bacterium]|nr:metallophosphatase family protein [Planctomycetales bacterium]